MTGGGRHGTFWREGIPEKGQDSHRRPRDLGTQWARLTVVIVQGVGAGSGGHSRQS